MLKYGDVFKVTRRSERAELGSFGYDIGGNADQSQLGWHVFVYQSVVPVPPPTRPHLAHSSGVPLGLALSADNSLPSETPSFRL